MPYRRFSPVLSPIFRFLVASRWLLASALCISLLVTETAWGQAVAYPATPEVDQEDDYFGTTVVDPFRWLEEDVRSSTAVRDWVEAQNEVSFAYLETLAKREAIAARLTELWTIPPMGCRYGRDRVISIFITPACRIRACSGCKSR